MPSVFCRAILFLSGYAPLFLIFFLDFHHRYRWWALVPLSVGSLSFVGLLVFLYWVRTSAPRPIHVKAVERKDAEVIAYMFAYVFPFLDLKIGDPASVIGLSIFFVVLMILNVSSNLIHINPILNLLRYHVYEVTTADEDTITIVAKRNRLVPGIKLDAVTIGDGLFMER